MFSDSNFEPIALSYLSFIDDKEYNPENEEDMKRYVDSVSAGLKIYFYEDQIFFISQRRDIEQSISYYLNSVDKRGKNRKQLIEFDYIPYFFHYS